MLNIIILISIIFILFLSFLLLTEKKKPIFVNPFIPEERNFEIKRNFIAYDLPEVKNLLAILNKGRSVNEITALTRQAKLIQSINRDYSPTTWKFRQNGISICR